MRRLRRVCSLNAVKATVLVVCSGLPLLPVMCANPAGVTGGRTEQSAGNADGLGVLEKALRLKELSDKQGVIDCLRNTNEKSYSGTPLYNFCMVKAWVAEHSGDNGEAIKYLKKAVAISPNATSLGSLGSNYYDVDDYQKCIDTLERAIKLDPNNALALYSLSRAVGHLNQLERAVELMSRVIAIEPMNAGAIRERAGQYLALNRRADAERDVATLQKLFPDRQYSMLHAHNASLKYSGDLSKWVSETLDTGERELTQELQVLRQNIAHSSSTAEKATLLEQAAQLELMHGDYKRSLSYLNEAAALGDNTYRLHSIKAACLSALKKYEDARAERKLTVRLYVEQKLRKESPQ